MSRRAAPSVGESAPRGGQPALQQCDRAPATRRSHCDPELIILTTIAALLSATMLLPEARASASSGSSSIIIDQGAFSGAQLLPTSGSPSSAGTRSLPAHLQPVSVFGGRHRGSAAAINLTHLALDELTGSVYVGATNWLFQLSAASLRPDVALRTGPAAENPRDCAPSDCLVPLAHVDAAALPLHHAHPALDLGVAGPRRPALQTLNVSLSAAQRRSAMVSSGQQQQQQHNNYNKLLLVEPEARQLLVCGSLNQGACRKHQLGQVSNYSELVPLPVASNDELSSSVALITRRSGQHQQAPLLYVAATNSRLGPYRDQVPPISARYLEPANRAMQIIERSFTESARLDISSELRDYYLVNYVHTFQHQDFVYFATVQRKSPLRQLEEWGYITRLARLCLSDLSFQSYTELTLECKLGQVNYNLLQDAQLVSASSHLAQHLGIRPQSAVLIGAFALSRDHTTRTQPKSAVCLFPMDRIEQAFTDNIHLCFNGSAKARNMNYIAGAVNDCPKPGKAGNVANFCSEPLKLNGSLSLSSSPVLSYDDQLISALTATQAHTGALGAGSSATSGANLLPHLAQEQRSHQVLVLGTGEGALRRVALISAGATLRAHELDAVQLAQADQDQPQTATSSEPVLADLLIQPAAAASGSGASDGPQFALAATPHRLVRLRINGCRASQVRSSTLRSTNNGSSSANLADECNACAHLQDPFCGWCATSGSCSTREECRQQQQVSGKPAHWAPFDQVQCAHYQPVWPQSVALQVSRQVSVDVNVPLAQPPSSHAQQAALGLQLAQAHFVCHFEYLASGATGAATNYSRRSASTRATQVRLNAHASSVSISCPLPPLHQRPASAQLPHEPPADQVRTRLTVRLANSPGVAADQMVAALALRSSGIERELSLYDCATHSTCRTCLGTGNTKRGHTCAWCPLSAKCTFDASDADLGCAAAAVSSTTPHSASGGPNGVRASHLAGSLDQAQASVFGIALHRPAQCPADDAQTERPAASKIAGTVGQPAGEILVHSGSRRAIQVNLRQPLPNGAGGRRKLECIFELEGAKMRVGARLLEANQQVVCQETALTYLEEVSTQRAQLSLILNEQQVIETSEVILYKCHLFGVSPPALTSSGGLQHSSAAWRAHELLQLADPQPAQLAAQPHRRRHAPLASDCSLCLNVERKYQCVWCKNQCLQAEQCSEMGASTTCPPPRIDSIQPTSGPLEGGTLLTIEGSNLGSNEREIQDKISVGGEPCQLVMYSVSTRIVCKTGPSLHGPQAATVFVGNRAGVTSAQEKFHYKAVHLTDVKPNIGPVSGGTRLTLSGSNLNVGSRLQVFLDDIPCALDSNAASSNQITCVTAPNLLATSMRITRLTLMLDNSTHHLPYPFTYQPDPIITSIEPAESFVSGGRLIVLVGQHLDSPQSVKLMVYHEQRHSLINGTSCFTQNDTHITCLTPAMPELLSLSASASTTTATSFGEDFQSLSSSALDTQVQQPQHQSTSNPLSRIAGGVKLKMSFFMDDVRSVRNLDEYYHHLPHYLTYFEDPRLYRLSTPVVEYTPELVISGENLDMPDLDQDIHVTIGNQVCLFKSYNSNQIVCSPPVQVMSLVERPILPIVAVIGTNIKYDIGYMQYNSNNIIRSQPPLFAQLPHDDPNNNIMSSFSSSYQPVNPYSGSRSEPSTSSPSTSSGVAILVSLSIVGFLVGLVATLMFALSRFRQSKAEREYKRIQLQMGSLDINGQPMGGNIFENIHINNAAQQTGAGSRALNYVGGAFAGKKLFYQLNQQLPSFPPSPLTDISSLTGSNPMAYNQHVVKLSSNGTIMNSTAQQPQQHHYNSATNSNNSSQSSPGSTRNSSNLFNQSQQSNGFSNQQQHHLQHHQQQLFNNSNHDKSNLLTINGTQANTRNFNWTQEAPSTIVPYAVIEACNLTLEGKNAIKEFV